MQTTGSAPRDGDTQRLARCAERLLDSLKKASGEGSRGGRVIGHTKTGKPIYENRGAAHASYRTFTPADHRDAMHVHASSAHHGRYLMGYGTTSPEEYEKTQSHEEQAQSHFQAQTWSRERQKQRPPRSMASQRAPRSLGETSSGKPLFSGGLAGAAVNKHPIHRAPALRDRIAGGIYDGLTAPHDHPQGQAAQREIMALAAKHFPGHTSHDHLTAAFAHQQAMQEHFDTPSRDGPEMVVGKEHHAIAQFHHMAGHYLKAVNKSQIDRTPIKSLHVLAKSSGEGSRGGRIIGHTRSGKPIYASGHPANIIMHELVGRKHGNVSFAARSAHEDYTANDHEDAARIHAPQSLDLSDAHTKAARMMQEDAHRTRLRAAMSALSAKKRPRRKKSSGLAKEAHHGEGSHGGHIIGHTRSGKPIYSLRHDMNHIKGGRLAIAASHHLIGYTPDDFADAAAAHMQKFVAHRDKMPNRAAKHLKLSRLHAHTATEKGTSGDKMQMSGLHSSHGNHASLAAFHLREAEAKRQEDPAEALWHYGQVGLHSSAAVAARSQAVS